MGWLAKMAIAGAGGVAAALVVWAGVRGANARGSVAAIGMPAPSVSAQSLDGTSERAIPNAATGHVVLLNVWATWCGPCREEMASLEALHAATRGRPFRIVAVSVDRGTNAAETVRAYIARENITFDVVHDAEQDVMRAYGVYGLPTTFVIDRSGVLQRRIVGAQEWDTPAFRAYADSLIGRGSRLSELPRE